MTTTVPDYDSEIIANTSSYNALDDKTVQADGPILAYNIFLYFVIAVGVPGNLVALTILLKIKAASSTDWFIIFITLFDFISSLANVPVYLSFTTGAWKKFGSDYMCRLHMYMSQIVVLSSAMLTMALAIDRYVVICRPGSVKLSSNKALKVCCSICFVSAVFSAPAIPVYRNVHGRCVADDLDIWLLLYYIFFFLVFILVFIVVIMCYFKIYFVILRSAKVMATHVEVQRARNAAPVDQEATSHKQHPVEGSTGAWIRTNRDQLECDRAHDRAVDFKEPTIGNIERKSEFQASLNLTGQSDSVAAGNSHTQSRDIPQSVVDTAVTATTTKTNTSINKFKKRLRTTKITFLVCLIYIVSWVFPFLCFILLWNAGLKTERSELLVSFALFGKVAYLVNTFVNPVLYAFLNKKYREELRACFRVLTHCGNER